VSFQTSLELTLTTPIHIGAADSAKALVVVGSAELPAEAKDGEACEARWQDEQ
jgi:hypothetical protein